MLSEDEKKQFYNYIRFNDIPIVQFPFGISLTRISVARNYNKTPIYRLFIPVGQSCVRESDIIQADGLLPEMLEVLYLHAPHAFDFDSRKSP